MEEEKGMWEYVIGINYNRDIHETDNDGDLAIHYWAPLPGLAGMIRDSFAFLLKRTKNINHKNHNGWTALHRAVHAGNKDAVQRLLEKGADEDASEPHGATPLMLATSQNNYDIGRMLLDQRAYVNLQMTRGRGSSYYNDVEGWTALHAAPGPLRGQPS